MKNIGFSTIRARFQWFEGVTQTGKGHVLVLLSCSLIVTVRTAGASFYDNDRTGPTACDVSINSYNSDSTFAGMSLAGMSLAGMSLAGIGC